jgi:hypothetical protein
MLKVIFVFASAMVATTGHSTGLNTRLRLKEYSVSNAFVHSTQSSPCWVSSNNSSARLQTSYAPVATDLSLMLALGAGFLLFGALLRSRRGSRASKFSIAPAKEINQDAENWKTTEIGRPHLSQTPRPTNDNSEPTCLPSLIGEHGAFPGLIENNEIR